MRELRKTWGAYKFKSEEIFKKAHAKELLSADRKQMTGYPIKFDKDLGPWLDKYEAAVKAKKPVDKQQHMQKARAAIFEYRKRITANDKVLGDAADPLLEGLKKIDKDLV